MGVGYIKKYRNVSEPSQLPIASDTCTLQLIAAKGQDISKRLSIINILNKKTNEDWYDKIGFAYTHRIFRRLSYFLR